jgi:hypothetical protein
MPESTLYTWVQQGRLRSRMVQAGFGLDKLVHADRATIADLKTIRTTPAPWRRLPPQSNGHDVLDAGCSSNSQQPSVQRSRAPQTPTRKARCPGCPGLCLALAAGTATTDPPGPKTMARGWQRLAEMLDGFTLAQELQHV